MWASYPSKDGSCSVWASFSGLGTVPAPRASSSFVGVDQRQRESRFESACRIVVSMLHWRTRERTEGQDVPRTRTGTHEERNRFQQHFDDRLFIFHPFCYFTIDIFTISSYFHILVDTTLVCCPSRSQLLLKVISHHPTSSLSTNFVISQSASATRS